ncbi:MAG TPA: hypothetical protein DCS93_02500 [Microscillaceae bacterium]|nr:hypothetical protein [Microscillaceae bacterium]
MIRNYFTTFLRNIKRNKVYSLINISGLAVGMTCAILLYLYIRHEMGYNLHYKDADRIYRVDVISSRKGVDKYHVNTSGPYGPTLKQDYPQVEAMTRMRFLSRELIEYNNKRLYEENIFSVGPGFFDVFSHKFIKGNPKTALKEPNTIVLTKTSAKKIFGRVAEALNKAIKVEEKTYQVVGVIEDLPDNSDIQFNAVLSFPKVLPKFYEKWGSFNLYTYIKLRKGVDAVQFEQKMQEMRDKYMQTAMKRFQETYRSLLFPLTKIHLYSSNRRAKKSTGILYVFIFSTSAIFILLIACVNYMNLATARSVNRAKEVGIRKAVGSYRLQLVQQFLFEAFFTVILALLVSLVLAEIALPLFNKIASKNLSLLSLLNVRDVTFILGGVLLVSLISGSYPAFVLSGFRPVMVLKGKFGSNRKGILLRRGLVIFQFAISITMIISTWMVSKQLSYIHNKNLGYAKDQVLYVTINSPKTRKKIGTLRQELLKHSQISGVTASYLVPHSGSWSNGTYSLQNPDNTMRRAEIDNAQVGPTFVQTMGIGILAGSNFTDDKADKNGVLVNETLAKMMGWKIGDQGKLNPLGKILETGFDEQGRARIKYRVIGVMRDFHLRSLHQSVLPLVIRKAIDRGWALLVRVKAQNIQQTMAYIDKVWKNADKVYPLQATFLDQTFAKQYQKDERRGMIFYAFSVLTIFIACLGLFGLVSFTVQQRTKEIAVRKVLGASEQSILKIISRDFVILILLANLVAFPAAYFVVESWLQSFAYRTSMSVVAFVLAGAIALLIAVFTISIQALKATKVNPVNVLKYE